MSRLASIALLPVVVVLGFVWFGWTFLSLFVACVVLWWGQRMVEAYIRRRQAAKDESV